MSSLFNPATDTVVSPFSKPISAASFKAWTLSAIDGSGKIALINFIGESINTPVSFPFFFTIVPPDIDVV